MCFDLTVGVKLTEKFRTENERGPPNKNIEILKSSSTLTIAIRY